MDKNFDIQHFRFHNTEKCEHIFIPAPLGKYWCSQSAVAKWDNAEQERIQPTPLNSFITLYKTKPALRKDVFLEKKDGAFCHNAEKLAILNHALDKGVALEGAQAEEQSAFQTTLEDGYALQQAYQPRSYPSYFITSNSDLANDAGLLLAEIDDDKYIVYSTTLGGLYKIDKSKQGEKKPVTSTLCHTYHYGTILENSALRKKDACTLDPDTYGLALKKAVENTLLSESFHSLALGGENITAAGTRRYIKIFDGDVLKNRIPLDMVHCIDSMLLTDLSDCCIPESLQIEGSPCLFPPTMCLTLRTQTEETKHTRLSWIYEPTQSADVFRICSPEKQVHSHDFDHTITRATRLTSNDGEVSFSEFYGNNGQKEFTTTTLNLYNNKITQKLSLPINFVHATQPHVDRWRDDLNIIIGYLSTNNPNQSLTTALENNKSNLSLESLLVAAHIVEKPLYALLWPEFKPKKIIQEQLLSRKRNYGTLHNGITVNASADGGVILSDEKKHKSTALGWAVPSPTIADSVLETAITMKSTDPITEDIEIKFDALGLVLNKENNTFFSTPVDWIPGCGLGIMEWKVQKSTSNYTPTQLAGRTYNPAVRFLAFGKRYNDGNPGRVDWLQEEVSKSKKRPFTMDVMAQTLVWRGVEIPIVTPRKTAGEFVIPLPVEKKDRVEPKIHYTWWSKRPYFYFNKIRHWDHLFPRIGRVVGNGTNARVVEERSWLSTALINPFAWGRAAHTWWTKKPSC